MNLILLLLSLLSIVRAENKLPVDKIQTDGPYISYTKDKIFVTTVFEEAGVKSIVTDDYPVSDKKNITLHVATDEPGKTFSFKLKHRLDNEKSDYGKVSKLLVISDIESNFKALKTLLLVNGVIDENYKWIYGKGHLALTGDFFDRGNQQNEVLWLIYSLEEQAKEAKGYVHFILGNHEIMNMNGDFRYVNPRYMEHSRLMNTPYISLYWENTELGRWLRTKNIAERINDILFVHGGISPLVNLMNLPAAEINTMARPFYPDTSYNYPDIKIEILFSDLGPFWYRGYYSKKVPVTDHQIDSTLNLFNVKYIATGHTIISDSISVLYKGRVFNTDVHHSGGHSEAMLVEEGKFYRVNAKGDKKLLK